MLDPNPSVADLDALLDRHRNDDAAMERSFAGISVARSTAIRSIAFGAPCATSARTIGVSKRKTLPP
jgi:hypothetical protein